MRLSLLIYTIVILAVSTAEFLSDPSVPSTIHKRLDDVKNEEGRLPRRYSNDEAKIKRLHIERHTGFDGKVYNIEIEPNEERPEVGAYDLPKKKLENNGFIERVNTEKSQVPKELSRHARFVEVYGMPKKTLKNNGVISRISPVAILKVEGLENDASSRRITRSIPKEPENEANDLEAQDAKVFRPLFVYRQQVAKRQKLNKRRDLVYGTPYSHVYRPWIQRYPTH